MNNLSLLKENWKKSKLTPVLYHTTFIENAPLIFKDRRIIANKGGSICKAKNRLVSLSDRITKGIIEFFGNVVFEFNALSIYGKNKSITPKIYGSSNDIKKYDEVPLFENEWVVPKELKFDLEDVNEVLLITSRDFKEPAFKSFVRTLTSNGVAYSFLSERWLPDNMVTDMTSYLIRFRRWRKFKDAEIM
ncbi:MAG: hypothetical protein AB1633_06535 [Elusimicrobiota bacterium]